MNKSDWQKTIIEEAREFSDKEIRPFAHEFEVNEGIPRELIKKMAGKKYLAAPFPEEYGGLGLDPVYYGFLNEEIGKGCSSVRALLTVHTSLVGETLMRWGSQEQKDKWLPVLAAGEKIAAFALTEPEVGTDAGGVKTTYTKQGDTYIINGKKKWITYAAIADVFLTIASNEGKVTAFLVERGFKGVKTVPIKGLLGSRAAYVAEIEFENVEVPESNVIGKPGGGFTYIVNTALDYGRYSVAWAGVAIAEAALEEMVAYSRKRQQFGTRICKFQLIQEIIANAVTGVHAARSLCISAGEMRKEKHDNAVIQTTIAKYFSSQVAMKTATDAVQVHGGNGCYNKYPVERLFREAKILEIIEGTSQIQQVIISHFGLKRYNRD